MPRLAATVTAVVNESTSMTTRHPSFRSTSSPQLVPLETHCCRALAEVSTDELFDHGDSLAAGDSLGSDRFGTDGQVSKEVRLHRDAYLSKNDAK
jgi:hypothetical protein